jgi:hypothetical protein
VKKPTAGKHMATTAASTPKDPAAVVQLRMSVLQQMVQNNAGIYSGREKKSSARCYSMLLLYCVCENVNFWKIVYTVFMLTLYVEKEANNFCII